MQQEMQKEKWRENLEVKIINNGGVLVSTGVARAKIASRGTGATIKAGKININAEDNFAFAA